MLEHNWVGSDYVILANIGVHFSTFNPELYARRLMEIKSAAENFKRISPETLVYIRTTTRMRGNMLEARGIVNGWVQDRLRELDFKILGESDAVHIFDPYWNQEAWFDKMKIADIHPPKQLTDATIEYFIDLYCFHSKSC